MIAYDVPNWRIKQEGGYNHVPEIRQQEIDHEQAEQAFTLLESALSTGLFRACRLCRSLLAPCRLDLDLPVPVVVPD